jgi:hypothetical protein
MLSPLYTWPLPAALHFAALEMSGLGFGFHGQPSQLAGTSSAKRHSTSTAKLLLLLQRLRCLIIAEVSCYHPEPCGCSSQEQPTEQPTQQPTWLQGAVCATVCCRQLFKLKGSYGGLAAALLGNTKMQ